MNMFIQFPVSVVIYTMTLQHHLYRSDATITGNSHVNTTARRPHGLSHKLKKGDSIVPVARLEKPRYGTNMSLISGFSNLATRSERSRYWFRRHRSVQQRTCNHVVRRRSNGVLNRSDASKPRDSDSVSESIDIQMLDWVVDERVQKQGGSQEMPENTSVHVSGVAGSLGYSLSGKAQDRGMTDKVKDIAVDGKSRMHQLQRQVTDLLNTLMLGYDKRLRPDFGGENFLRRFIPLYFTCFAVN